MRTWTSVTCYDKNEDRTSEQWASPTLSCPGRYLKKQAKHNISPYLCHTCWLLPPALDVNKFPRNGVKLKKNSSTKRTARCNPQQFKKRTYLQVVVGAFPVCIVFWQALWELLKDSIHLCAYLNIKNDSATQVMLSSHLISQSYKGICRMLSCHCVTLKVTDTWISVLCSHQHFFPVSRQPEIQQKCLSTNCRSSEWHSSSLPIESFLFRLHISLGAKPLWAHAVCMRTFQTAENYAGKHAAHLKNTQTERWKRRFYLVKTGVPR